MRELAVWACVDAGTLGEEALSKREKVKWATALVLSSSSWCFQSLQVRIEWNSLFDLYVFAF